MDCHFERFQGLVTWFWLLGVRSNGSIQLAARSEQPLVIRPMPMFSGKPFTPYL